MNPVTAVISTLYRKILGRPADPAGLATFSAVIEQGGSPDGVASALLGSEEYKAKSKRYKAKSKAKRPSASLLPRPVRARAYTPPTYDAWTERFDSLSPPQVEAARRHLASLDLAEVLGLLVVTEATLVYFDEILASWRGSVHRGWALTVICSPDLALDDVASLEAVAAADPTVSILRSADEVRALTARYRLILLCFGGVQLNPLSLYMFAEAAMRTGADLVYSDHDVIDKAGRRTEPAFKPRFSPYYLQRYNYIGDCLMISRSGGLSDDEAGALLDLTVTAYDLLVADLARGRSVEHIPFVLFHARERQARSRHPEPDYEDGGPSVAIIIPTRDGLAHLKPCIEGILERTSYNLDLVEIVIVDNQSTDPETLRFLNTASKRRGVRVIPYPHLFNFAEVNNVAARQATQDILVFLNNDTDVIDPRWLSKLVWYAKQPEVGIVGGKLLFPDGTVQHGGCAAGVERGSLCHLLLDVPAEEVALSDHTREMSAVTGACIAVRRRVFEEVGGFDPILKITWNDVKLCFDCLTEGYRNIYVADPLFHHDESKTRGRDKETRHMDRFFREAIYTRKRFPALFQDDPSYSPNLSTEVVGGLSEPPRVLRPWLRAPDRPRRILMLSMVHKVGFGVPLVMQQQARKLVELGYEVVIGGPKGEAEFAYPGCERVILGSAREAAAYAFETDIGLVISHTPPYFELPNLIGSHIKVLAYDYGEPPAEFFPEPTRSYLIDVNHHKRFAAPLTTAIASISQAVKDEGLNNACVVAGLANSHLPAWSEALRAKRDRTRRMLGWEDRFVVLTVCRFSQNERAYKGLTRIAQFMLEYPHLHPDRSLNVTWALAGAGSREDVKQVEALGFEVFPNVSDEMLASLYTAADAYMGFSRWEGYNLGISQALAMGLPTLGSDIPAHREFPISTTNSTLTACNWLAEQVVAGTASGPERRAIRYDWEESVTRFARIVGELLPPPRRSGRQPDAEAYRVEGRRGRQGRVCAVDASGGGG